MARALKEKSCLWCSKQFTTRSTTSCCSLSCAAKLRCRKHGYPPWREEEIEVLERLSGCQPLDKIVTAIQRLDRKHDWKERSSHAVRSEMIRRGLSFDCSEDNISARKLAQTLGIKVNRVHYWISAYGLPCKRLCAKKLAISLKQFRLWAYKHSRLLEGLEFERLNWVLEDEQLARQLSQKKARRPGVKVQLRRIDTKEQFKSLSEAASKNFLSAKTFQFHLCQDKQRFVCGGISWEVIGHG